MKWNFGSWAYLAMKSCLICGSYQIFEHELCSVCCHKISEKIKYQRGRISIAEKKLQLPFASLIEWIPSESDHLSRFFLKLKGIRQKKVWGYLARLFLKENILLRKPLFGHGKTLLIPCPSKSLKPDHGEQWGLALAREMNWEYWPCFQWNSSPLVKQRFKRRAERLDFPEGEDVKFTVKPSFISDLLEEARTEKNFIFADDVITTGATAAQAYLALKQPKNFMVISLGRRAVAKDSPIW